MGFLPHVGGTRVVRAPAGAKRATLIVGISMSPLLRLWGFTALCVAVLLVLRGLFVPALAVFLFSPAPVLLFSHGVADQRHLSLSWLGLLLVVIAVLGALFATVVYLGGIPPVHEWSAVVSRKTLS